MADRKQFESVGAPDPELIRLLEATRNVQVSEDELREQRISFAFGNALNSELLILLCYKNPRRQHGQRGSERERWVAIWRRSVAMD